jgi:hypothetical protein
MPVNVPPDARCRSCGYQLRELDRPVCPECAREFDPADPSTYIDDPRRRRRRRIIAWAVSLLTVALLAFGLCPRGLLRGRITFASPTSGVTMTIRRWEFESPRWIPLRYPGFHWTTWTPGGADSSDGGLDVSALDVVVGFEFSGGGSARASGSSSADQILTINGIPALPETGARLLKALQAPGNMGVALNSISAAEARTAADDQ